MKTRKGIFYFETFPLAREWAQGNGWPVEFIHRFGLGWAVQSGPSGNYAGPGETPREWNGN